MPIVTVELVGDDQPDREPSLAQSLADVIARIRAREAWEFSRGAGITIAVVDTGINGERPEFPAAKRQGSPAQQLSPVAHVLRAQWLRTHQHMRRNCRREYEPE